MIIDPSSSTAVSPHSDTPARGGDHEAPLRSHDEGVVPLELRQSIRILVIDDDRTLREGCASALRVDGYNVTTSGRGDEAVAMAQRSVFDVVLVDLHMTLVSGMEILKAVLAARPGTIVVMMTGNPSVTSSVEALRVGAWDYLPKPFSGSHLQLLVGRAAYAVRATREKDKGRSTLHEQNGNSERMTLLVSSPAFRRVVDLATRVAMTDASVMLVGESGTGKELIAHFVHRHSRRARNPLVPLNCAAVPEYLLESEVFGHRKGSFTGADRDKVGLLEVAHNGTFFLDEITEMPLTLQAKLLRVVQDGVVRRVGSEQQDAIVKVRFISATNRDPREAIHGKQLREDLFYRLNVFPIHLPPLRERVEDIPVLARHFLELSWRCHRNSRDPLPTFSDAAMDVLQSCPWRGNVRELQNVVEHLVVLATPGSSIAPHEVVLHDEPPGGAEVAGTAAGTPAIALNDGYQLAKERVLTKFEKDYVVSLVARASGNMSRAARMASVDRTTLYRLLGRHGFRREAREIRLA
ncbi:MAG TPA: sigma-54 dependent transcriptional regulator [Gemmatimonadaceae bacterium]|nr:sigma-54 dependent transcriptional regulator [Gemmatimonadaceae bacterium]